MPPRPIPRLSLLCTVLLALGCAKADTLTVKPTAPGDAELMPSPRLEEYAYKKILLLPYEGDVVVKELDIAVLTDKDGAYYTGKLEKALLARGFEVISPEIVARVAKNTKGTGKLSAVEKAMVMGKETKADAVFVTQSIELQSMANFYAVEELETAKVDASKVQKDDKSEEYYQPETKDCVYRLPYYSVHMEGKLIDAKTGNVLWVGSGRQTAIDSLSESYVAKLGKKCELVEENFVFSERLAGEPQLAATFGGLVSRLFDPLKTVALKGKAIPVDKPAAKPKKPPPKKEEKVEPKAKTAVVSKKKASLRSGPGKRNDRLRYVSRKTKVEIVETMGEWSKVKLQDGAVGWMHESTIIVNE